MVTNKAIQAKSSVLMMIKWPSPNCIILEALHRPSECIGTGSLLTSAPCKFPQLANECYKWGPLMRADSLSNATVSRDQSSYDGIIPPCPQQQSVSSIHVFIHEFLDSSIFFSHICHSAPCVLCQCSFREPVSPVSRTAGGKVSHHLASKGWVCRCHMLHSVSTRIYTAAVENVSAHRAWWWGPSASLPVYLTVVLQRKPFDNGTANNESPFSWKCDVCVHVHAQDQAVISLQRSLSFFFFFYWRIWARRIWPLLFLTGFC